MMNLSPWKILPLTVAIASLGYGLPAQAKDIDSISSNWQTLCQRYLPASACETNSTTETWVTAPDTNLPTPSNSQGSTSLADKLPTLPPGTPESSVNCFMRNIDGSLLDLTQLCNATANHPLLAQISITKTAPAPSKPTRKLSKFSFK